MPSAAAPARLSIVPGQRPAQDSLPGFEAEYAETSDAQAATRAWMTLVYSRLLGERDAIRITEDAGVSYPPRLEYRLGGHPARPAASYVCTDKGLGRLIALDFDAKPDSGHAPWQAAADAAGARLIVERCGGAVIEDLSPSGGRHLYIPLREPVPHARLKLIARALEKRLHGPGWHKTYDKSPMMSADGLIRLPGSPHPLGGYQALTTPLPRAATIARRGNPPQFLQRLTDELETELAALAPQPLAGTALDTAHLPSGPRRQLPPYFEAIARTGTYDPARYRSGSEARLAVLRVARIYGWTLPQIIERARPDAAWPGLGRFFERYSPTVRDKQWQRDWATTAISRSKTAPDVEHHRRSFLTRPDSTPPGTPPPDNRRGQSTQARPVISQGEEGRSNGPSADQIAEWGYVRHVVAAVAHAEAAGRWDDRGGISVRLVLRAAAYAALVSGSRYIDFGTRFIGLYSTLDRSTAAACLRRLRAEEDPFLVLVEDERGIRGDLYEWRIPDAYADIAARRGPAPGRLEPTHPVFHALGSTAAIAYQAVGTLEAMPADIARTSRLSPSAQRKALTLLAEMGMVERGEHGWRRTGANLDALATALGADEIHQQIADRYALERAAWQAVCAARPALGALDILAAWQEEHDEGLAAWREALADDEPPTDEPEPAEPAEPPAPQPPEAPSPAGPGAVGTTSRSPEQNAAAAVIGQFTDLPRRHRAVLAELFHADQDAEREEKAREAAGERSRPAAVWRTLTAAGPEPGPLARTLAALVGTAELPRVLDELAEADLINQEREEALFATRITVRLTRRARKITRVGLGIPAPPKRPPGMLSEGLWRCLQQVAATGADGLPDHQLWDKAPLHLAEGTRHRPGKRFIAAAGGRWYLTGAGAAHMDLAENYEQLYPDTGDRPRRRARA